MGPELAREIRAEVRRRRRRRITAGLAAASAVVAAFLLRPAGSVAVAPVAANPAVVLSEPARRILPDGSTVELKPGAEISVDYSRAVRRVALLRGVAHFQVAKNPARPFVVTANDVDVRAVGTAFSVELGTHAVEVIVTEGTVALEQAQAPAVAGPLPVPGAAFANGRHVVAGEHALVSLAAVAAPTVEAVSPQEMTQRMAWRVPRLEFSGTPLTEVVELFRRHGGMRLVIDDPSLGQVRVSGILRADNLETLLQLLAADHGITAETHGDETVLARHR